MNRISGKILALDVGDARVGVAVSDPTGFLASPVEIIKRDSATITRVIELVRLHEAAAVMVGLPLNMDGTTGFQAKKVQRFAEKIAEAVAPAPVILEDERESTVTAREMRLERGTKRKKRQGRIDAEAAAIFLQAYLDRNRADQLGVSGLD